MTAMPKAAACRRDRVAIIANHFPHQKEHAEAMAEGLARHNIETKMYGDHERPGEDVVICWGWRLGRPMREAGKEVLVMERGYINRMDWASLGWNGLNGRAQRGWDMQGPRLDYHFARTLRPWRAGGKYALVIGQVPGDESTRGIDMTGWYRMAVAKCYEMGFPSVRFRPHPVAVQHGDKSHVFGAETDVGPLQQSLESAALVVTYNSNTGVDALLAGKPTIACDLGSMAWPVAAHDFVVQAEPRNREAWANQLAWSQFSTYEMRSGYAWDVVKDSQTLQ